MKNTIRMIVAAGALAIAVPAYAQGGGGGGGGGMQMSPAERAARQKEMMFKDITLSAAQSAKIDTIMTEAGKKQMEAMMAARSGGGDPTAMRESMAKMNTERNAALKAVLTSDEHKKKFDENVAAMPQGRRGGL